MQAKGVCQCYPGMRRAVWLSEDLHRNARCSSPSIWDLIVGKHQFEQAGLNGQDMRTRTTDGVTDGWRIFSFGCRRPCLGGEACGYRERAPPAQAACFPHSRGTPAGASAGADTVSNRAGREGCAAGGRAGRARGQRDRGQSRGEGTRHAATTREPRVDE